MQGYSLY